MSRLRERDIARVITTPAPAPGFIGEGHTAVSVVTPGDFAHTDPFIALMDDRINLEPGRTAGEAHPHGGFETVTFVVEGALRDRDEGLLETGDVLWMTAGSGVIHNEHSVPLGRTRVLQMWLTLPHDKRWAAPRFEHVKHADAPVRIEPGVEARVYSGTSGHARASTHNYVPVTLVDIQLDAGGIFEQDLPASYNGFVYVLDGGVAVGAQRRRVAQGQVAWIAQAESANAGALRVIGGPRGSRVVLYAGERQNVPIAMHGPFVGETRADLMRLSKDFMDGKLPRLSQLHLGNGALSK